MNSKIKIIQYHDASEFENMVNDFIKENDIAVLSVQYQVATLHNGVVHCAFIHYRKNN